MKTEPCRSPVTCGFDVLLPLLVKDNCRTSVLVNLLEELGRNGWVCEWLEMRRCERTGGAP